MVVTASCSFTIWSLNVFGIYVFSLVHNFTRHYMDDLQVLTTIYTLLVSCPLYSFVVLCLDEHRNMESQVFFGGSVYSCPEILVSSHLMWGDIPDRWSPRFPFALVACVSFPHVSHALILLPFFSKNSSYSPSSSSYIVFGVWKFSKKKAPAHSVL